MGQMESSFVCKCGSVAHYGKGMCKKCYIREYMQQPELKKRRAAAERLRRSANRDDYNAKERERHKRRSVSRRQYQVAYYAANAEKLKEYQKEYRQREREKTRFLWRRTNARRKKSRVGMTYKQWGRIVEFYAPDGMCPCCKQPFDDKVIQRKLTMDHVVPMSRGGETTPGNVQPLCTSCNISKNNNNENDYRFDKGAFAWLI